MLMKVTALSTFMGQAGLIRSGSRPDLDEDYVKELERNGLVTRHEVKPALAPLTKTEQEALQAKADANEKADAEAKAKAMEEAKATEAAAAKQEKATK